MKKSICDDDIDDLTVAVPEIWNILEIQFNGGKKCAHSFEVPITFLELF